MKNSRVKIYIERILEGKIEKLLTSPEIIAILGARQVGKTTLMKRLYDDLPEPKAFVDFEDQEVLSLFEEDVKAFAQIYVQGKRYLLIDEFQYSKKGGKHLKYLYDNFETKFIISGSSSLDISLKAVSYLVGRVFILELFPLSFEEFLSYKDPDLLALAKERLGREETLPSALHERLLDSFEEFSIWGGYPRVVTASDEEERREVLKNIFNTYLLKDIRGFFRLATEANIQKLIRALAFQVGGMIQYNELSQVSELPYSALKRHLAILEETYILELVRPFYTNKRLEITKNPKVYFVDPGFRNYICQDFRGWNKRADTGSVIENAVATELMKKGLEFRYWRTKAKGEVDFVISEGSDIIPLEVKSGVIRNPGKGFLSFLQKYSPPRGYLLHAGSSSHKVYQGVKIHFLPLYGVLSLGFSAG